MEFYIFKRINPGKCISTEAGGKKKNLSFAQMMTQIVIASISIWGQEYV